MITGKQYGYSLLYYQCIHLDVVSLILSSWINAEIVILKRKIESVKVFMINRLIVINIMFYRITAKNAHLH